MNDRISPAKSVQYWAVKTRHEKVDPGIRFSGWSNLSVESVTAPSTEAAGLITL
jgi:hypothetical protein